MSKVLNYKPTGNIAVDMVAKCKDHYRKFYRTVKEVYLRPDLFNQFKEYVKRYDEEYVFEDAIDFDDTTVKCSTIIGNNPMIYYLNKLDEE